MPTTRRSMTLLLSVKFDEFEMSTSLVARACAMKGLPILYSKQVALTHSLTSGSVAVPHSDMDLQGHHTAGRPRRTVRPARLAATRR